MKKKKGLWIQPTCTRPSVPAVSLGTPANVGALRISTDGVSTAVISWRALVDVWTKREARIRIALALCQLFDSNPAWRYTHLCTTLLLVGWNTVKQLFECQGRSYQSEWQRAHAQNTKDCLSFLPASRCNTACNVNGTVRPPQDYKQALLQQHCKQRFHRVAASRNIARNGQNEEKLGPFVLFSTLQCRRFDGESVSYSEQTGRNSIQQ